MRCAYQCSDCNWNIDQQQQSLMANFIWFNYNTLITFEYVHAFMKIRRKKNHFFLLPLFSFVFFCYLRCSASFFAILDSHSAWLSNEAGTKTITIGMKVNKNSIMFERFDKKDIECFHFAAQQSAHTHTHTHLNDYCTFPICRNDWTNIMCKMTHTVDIHWQIFPFVPASFPSSSSSSCSCVFALHIFQSCIVLAWHGYTSVRRTSTTIYRFGTPIDSIYTFLFLVTELFTLFSLMCHHFPRISFFRQ